MKRIPYLAIFLIALVLQSAAYSLQPFPLVTINADAGQGAGVVIASTDAPSAEGSYIGLIATANHVVVNATAIETIYANGRKGRDGQVVAADAAADVAIVRAWIPDDIQPIQLATAITEGEVVTVIAHRGRIATRASLVFENRMFGDALLVPGDSGAPVVNAAGRLVGIVSGGWFWITDRKISDRTPTWPLRAGSVAAVRKLMETAADRPRLAEVPAADHVLWEACPGGVCPQYQSIQPFRRPLFFRR